jgi:hypothetical protein
MNVSHVVGTRFNLGRGKDSNWTNYRGTLLRLFCAAGVKAQTKKPFMWVVIVDAKTPNSVLNPIIKGLPCEIFRTPKKTGWALDLAEWLRARVPTEWTTFTRVDSDDALHPQYIEDIDAACTPHRQILTFKGGYVYRTKWKQAYRLAKTNTSFQTTVERTDTMKTGYCAAHGRMRRLYKTIVVPKFPRWIVIRHERNERRADNVDYPFPKVLDADLKKHFGFLPI